VDVVLFVVLNVVNHHFPQVLVRHLLESGLESYFVAESLGLAPEVLDSSLLLVFGHVVPLVFVVVSVVLLTVEKPGKVAPAVLTAVAHAVVVC